jgi:hypothetical protein
MTRRIGSHGLMIAAFALPLFLSGLALGEPNQGYSVQAFDSAGQRTLRFCASDGSGIRYMHSLAVLDRRDTWSGSTAVSAGDWIHVVWVNAGRVWYSGTREPVSASALRDGYEAKWLPSILVSPPAPRPAVAPEIATQGRYLAVSWRDSGQVQTQGFWRRVALIRQGSTPYWFTLPLYVSRSLGQLNEPGR